MKLQNRRVLDISVKGDQKSDSDFRIISALQSMYESAIISLYDKIDVDRKIFVNNSLIKLYGINRVSTCIEMLRAKDFLSGVECFIAYKDKSLHMVMNENFLRLDFKGCIDSNYLTSYIRDCEIKFNIGKHWKNRTRPSTLKMRHESNVLFKVDFQK